MAARRPESPLTKLARLLGGVVLMRGRLGHQVLGQLLVSDLRESELAGASVVMAAGSRRKSTLARAAIGTAAPAFALERHYGRVATQLDRRREAIVAREQAARERATTAGSGSELLTLHNDVASLRGALARLEAENAALRQRIAATTEAPTAPATTPAVTTSPVTTSPAMSRVVTTPAVTAPPAAIESPTRVVATIEPAITTPTVEAPPPTPPAKSATPAKPKPKPAKPTTPTRSDDRPTPAATKRRKKRGRS